MNKNDLKNFKRLSGLRTLEDKIYAVNCYIECEYKLGRARTMIDLRDLSLFTEPQQLEIVINHFKQLGFIVQVTSIKNINYLTIELGNYNNEQNT